MSFVGGLLVGFWGGIALAFVIIGAVYLARHWRDADDYEPY